MRRTAVEAVVLAAIGALLLTAAGCGGGDDESAADDQAPAITAQATTESSDEEVTETDQAEAPDFASSANCQKLLTLMANVSGALAGTGAFDVEQTRRIIDEYAETAPDEIRGDFRVVAEAYAKIAGALGDIQIAPGETPSPEVMQRLQEVASELDQAAVTTANTNITAWVAKNC
jgi:hypothetical protein